MATENNRYVRQIYVNGAPYLVRDEEAQTNIAQMKELLNKNLSTSNKMQSVLDHNFDGERYINTVDWSEHYNEKVTGSKIPKFSVDLVSQDEGMWTLTVGLW